MHIVIFGANGFLGRYLCRHLTRQGKEVVAVARSQEGWSGDGMFLEWDGRTIGPWALALEGAETVINLAGRSVNCRYTEKNRREILESRVDSTRVIGQAISACKNPPAAWINAGTATWYRDAEDKGQDEWLGEPATGFSCDVARKWEEAFFGAPAPAKTRKIALRISMVLANEPGTVYQILSSLTRFGLGGTMGRGTQRVSWIHMEDLLRAIDFLMADSFLSGIFNLSAPDIPNNRRLMGVFRAVVGMPIGLPAVRWMLEIGARVLRTETELILKSRWAEPLRLRDEGFHWRWGRIEDAVADLVVRPGLQGFFRNPARRSAGARAWLPATSRDA